MPGNEVGDRIHNFFAQDNLSQGQHHSQVVDKNWPVPNNNLWVGSQRQIGVLSSSPKNYNLQQPAQENIERAHNGHPFGVSHGLNPAPSDLRPEFIKSVSENQQLNLNGYMYGHQVFQSRQDEANLLEMDTESNQHNISSRSLSVFDAQQTSGPENPTKTLLRSETSESPVSFDFFGAQHQMNGQQPGLLQALQRQRSGFSDMQQLQQQATHRKIQELQRQQQQQQLRQLDARQQNSINQIAFFGTHAAGNNPPTFINGTPISEASNYSWPTDLTAGNPNWMQRGSLGMQGSSNGYLFSTDQGQAQCMMSLVPQQVDQSLYEFPISGSRGSLNQYSHMAVEKSSMQQMPNFYHSLPGNQNAVFSDQMSLPDGALISRQGFQEKDMFDPGPAQSLNGGINMENLQVENSLQRTTPLHEFHREQQITGPTDTLHDKSVVQVVSSQDAVALDPTEEKFLFGSDDGIWDAFGRSSNMSIEACNLTDGTSLFNGFPSVQSGSWSALMQSAVAETSSSDAGLKERWSGLSFQNAEIPAENVEPATYNDSRKQPALTDGNLQGASVMNSGSVHFSDDPNVSSSFQNDSGFQSFRHKFFYDHGEKQPTNSGQKPSQQSLEGGSKQLNQGSLQKPLAEGNQHYGKFSHPPNPEMDIRNISGSWTPQQSGSCQPGDKPSVWSGTESTEHDGDGVFKVRDSENSLQRHQSDDQMSAVRKEISQGMGLRKSNSGSDLNAQLQMIKSNVGSSQVNREGMSLDNAAAVQNVSTSKAGGETCQLHPNNHHLNYWKNIDSSVKSKRHEVLGNLQHHGNKGPESLLNTSDKGEAKMLDVDNKKQNSNKNYWPDVSHCPSASGLRDNVLPDACDSSTLPVVGKKNSSGLGRKSSGRKFQYHPMGNLDEDVEPPSGTRQASHSQALPQQSSRGLKNHDPYTGKSVNNEPISSREMGTGHLAVLQGDTKGFHEMSSRGTVSGCAPNISTPFDKSLGSYVPSKGTLPSQNMLELLQKAEQSQDRGTDLQMSSSERKHSSEMPETESSGGSVSHLQRRQSPASQGFGLQLAPPSQRLSFPNQAVSSRSSLHAAPFSSINVGHETRDGGIQHETYQGEANNNRIGTPGLNGVEALHYNRPGNFSSPFKSGFPFPRSQIHSPQMTVSSGLVTTNQSINMSQYRLDSLSKQTEDSCSKILSGNSAEVSLPDGGGSVPHDNLAALGDAPQVANSNIVAGEAAPTSQPHTILSGISQEGAFPKTLPNIWTDTSAQQRILGTQARHMPSRFSQSHQANIVESSCSTPQKVANQNAINVGNVPSDFSACSMDSQYTSWEEHMAKESPRQLVSSGSLDVTSMSNSSPVKGIIVKNLPDVSPLNPAATQRDIEAFGRTLKPNNLFHQSYSLLNQMRSMKNAETDQSHRGLKRSRGPEKAMENLEVASTSGQSNEQNATIGDAFVHRTDDASGDPKMLKFSGLADCLDRNASSQPGNIPTPDLVAFGRSDSQTYSSSNAASVRVEPCQISPQMAPSWFDQFGTFRNGQMLPFYDAQKATAVKTVEQLGKTSSTLYTLNSMDPETVASAENQVVNAKQNSTPVPEGIEHFSSPQSLKPDVGDQCMVVVRPKKGKSAPAELLPWHKEISQGSRSCQTISMAEVDWARVAHRLNDKVEDEAEMIDEVPTLLRTKRRLILTTHLMQQLLYPPPAAILHAEASSNCESVAYLVARLALGEACGLVTYSGKDSHAPSDNARFLSHSQTSETTDDHLSKVLENFLGRARNLEKNFVSMDKKASIADLRVECQDMEKISVINRFAKFHGRGQPDGAETSLPSEAALNYLKPCPQRYVTALPMPKNLPDRVQCLSL